VRRLLVEEKLGSCSMNPLQEIEEVTVRMRSLVNRHLDVTVLGSCKRSIKAFAYSFQMPYFDLLAKEKIDPRSLLKVDWVGSLIFLGEVQAIAEENGVYRIRFAVEQYVDTLSLGDLSLFGMFYPAGSEVNHGHPESGWWGEKASAQAGVNPKTETAS